MAVNCFHNAGKNKQELDILMRSHARIQHVDAGVGSQGPVVMFTGTIDALERFFMEQARHSVTACNLFHCFHNELVVINGKVCLCVDRCEFMLCRSDLVVLCLRSNAELPEVLVDIFHIRSNSFTDSSEVVVIHFLTFCRWCSE